VRAADAHEQRAKQRNDADAGIAGRAVTKQSREAVQCWIAAPGVP
jgi:hypothetical protein